MTTWGIIKSFIGAVVSITLFYILAVMLFAY